MSQQRIQINIDFPAPVENVFAFFEEHENLQRIFGAKISRIKAGTDTPNGKGSMRKLTIGPLPPIEATVTEYRKNERIEYTTGCCASALTTRDTAPQRRSSASRP